MSRHEQKGCVVNGTDVLVIGGAGVDTIVRVPALPLPTRDAILVPPIEDFAGHTGNGVALGCHTLGLSTEFADVIGDDDHGRLLRATYEKAGLPFTCRVHPSGTRRSVNLVDPHGNRLSLYDPRHPSGMDVDPGLYEPGIHRANHIHASIVNWARHALAAAVAAGRPTSTDLHDWDGTSDYHRDFAYQADIVFMSAAALGDRADETAAGILRTGRAQAVVTMAGADGARLAVRGAPVRVIPAARLPGRPVVDTNGAGDSFVAAFLYARLHGMPFEDAARAGAVAGAFACGTPGTHTSFIDAATLHAELARAAG
jgi:sugar/nucleoside kinase (ribokinase family)